MELYDPNEQFYLDEPCEGSGGYGDIGPGMPVTVRDEGGEVIGDTTMAAGRAGDPSSSTSPFSRECLLPFEVTLPRADFYSFELGRRGEITYSYEEMVGFAWQVSFSIGD
jgi:hypothetical protein